MKGANNNITAARYSLYDQYAIFVCNPLNQSARFDVIVEGRKNMYKANGTGTEWVGQKSMKIAPSNLYEEAIIAQYEFDEPCNITHAAKVYVSGRQKGGFGLIVTEIMLAGCCAVLFALAVVLHTQPRCVARLLALGNSNNWLNIPNEYELIEYEF